MNPQTRNFLYRGPIGPHVTIELADDDELYLSGPPEEWTIPHTEDSQPAAARETRTHQNPEPCGKRIHKNSEPGHERTATR